MTTNSREMTEVLDAMAMLREEIGQLNQRIEKLEAALTHSSDQPVAVPTQQLDEELIVIISAAIAAYLGVEPHIRQIRLIRDATWLQLGRATIQASHAINIHHG